MSLGRGNPQRAGAARRSAGGAEASSCRPRADSPTRTSSSNSPASATPFCIGVAGYPEGHPQCLNRTRDLEHLKRKVDNGGCFVITQLFFDNAEFYRFRDTARAMGIGCRSSAGIMPILNVAQIKRFVSMCGAKIPAAAAGAAGSAGDTIPKRFTRRASNTRRRQCQDLLDNGVDGLHFYTLNKSKATVQICKTLNYPHAS